MDSRGIRFGPRLLRALLGAGSTDPGPDSALHAAVVGIVARGQARGELRRNVSPRLAASMIVAGALAVLSEPISGPGAPTPETRRNELLHGLLHGLCEAKPRLRWSARGEAARA